MNTAGGHAVAPTAARPKSGRPLADMAAELVAEVSHTLTRALMPRQPMSLSERRQNLLSLAEIIISEDSWDVSKVITPAHRPLVRYYAVAIDPMPAFGRLLCALRDCDAAEADRALDRLVAA